MSKRALNKRTLFRPKLALLGMVFMFVTALYGLSMPLANAYADEESGRQALLSPVFDNVDDDIQDNPSKQDQPVIWAGCHICFVDPLDGNRVFDEKRIEAGQEVEFPEPPKHVGYKFKRWDGNLGEINSDTVIRAIYMEIFHKVSFKDGITGQNMTENVKVLHGGAVQPPAARKHTGYMFTGWSADLSNVTKDIEVTSLYQPISYRVFYHTPDGVSAPAPESFEYGKGIARLSGQASPYEGRDFLGWYTAEDGGESVSSIGKTIATDIHLYARYAPNRYTIMFDPHGGKGTMNRLTAICGEKVELPPCLYTNTYKVAFDANGGKAAMSELEGAALFLGWSLYPNGEIVAKDNAALESLASDKGATVTLYAQWGPATVLLPMSTKDGQLFDGWYDERTGGALLGRATSNFELTSNMTMYAHYTPVVGETSTITYDLDGDGTAEGSIHYTDGSNDITLEQPLKDGYEFKGWMGADLDEPVPSVTVPSDSIGDRNYTAIWEPKKYSVSFDANGGFGDMPSLSLAKDESKQLPTCTFTFPAHSFAGWALNPDGAILFANEALVKNIMTSGDVTLYAKWLDGDSVSMDRREAVQGPLDQGDSFGQQGVVKVVFNNNGTAGMPSSISISLSPGVPLTLPMRPEKHVSYTMEDPTTNLFRQGSATLPFRGWVDNDGAVWSPGTVFTTKMFDTDELSLTAMWEPTSISLPQLTSANAVFAGWYDSTLNMSGLSGEVLVTQDTTFTSRWLDKGVVSTVHATSVLLDCRAVNGSFAKLDMPSQGAPTFPVDIQCPVKAIFDADGGVVSGDSVQVAAGNVLAWTDAPFGKGSSFTPGSSPTDTTLLRSQIASFYPVYSVKLNVSVPKAMRMGTEAHGWKAGTGAALAPGETTPLSQSQTYIAKY